MKTLFFSMLLAISGALLAQSQNDKATLFSHAFIDSLGNTVSAHSEDSAKFLLHVLENDSAVTQAQILLTSQPSLVSAQVLGEQIEVSYLHSDTYFDEDSLQYMLYSDSTLIDSAWLFLSLRSVVSDSSEFEGATLDSNGIMNAAPGINELGFTVFAGNQPENYVTHTNFDNLYYNGGVVSSQYDTVTPGFQNQYSNFDAEQSPSNFVLINGSATSVYHTVNRKTEVALSISNATYAALSMRTGDMFAKKFGGVSGEDPDYFGIVVSAYGEEEIMLEMDTIFLADFRFDDNSQDYILEGDTVVRFVSDSFLHRFDFHFISSDTGTFGINTPKYACLNWIHNASNRYDLSVESPEDILNDSALICYPNPVSDCLFLPQWNHVPDFKAYLYAASGVMYSVWVRNGSIALETIPEGIYFLQISPSVSVEMIQVKH